MSPLPVASAAAGLSVLALLVAYAVAASTVAPTAGGIVSALALAGIAGSGLLYAWRLGAGGPVE